MSEAVRRIVTAEHTPELEKRRGRRFARVYAALVFLAAAAFVTLAFLVRAQGIVQHFDVPLTTAIQSVHLPAYGWILTHTSDLGWFPLNVVAYATVFVAFFALRLRLEATLGVIASLLAGLVGSGLKMWITRARPAPGLVHVYAHLSGFSFPSGHVIQYTTLFGFSFFVVWAVWRNSPWRNLVLLVLFLLVALVGPSRVYLGEHWPSDVIGAYLLASLWLAGTIELLVKVKPRHGQRESVRPFR